MRVLRFSSYLLSGEAVKQSVASSASQVVLAATSIWPARWMRGVPRSRGRVVAQALAVDVAEHGRPLRAARPVLASAVVGGREGFAIGGRAGQRVVTVRREADARYDEAALAQRVVEGQFVV